MFPPCKFHPESIEVNFADVKLLVFAITVDSHINRIADNKG